MKAIAVLILFCAPLYGADITTTNTVGDITTKVSERTAKDGKPEVRVETVYRGKARILQTLSQPDKQGRLAIVSRSYLVGGDLVMIESDEDGDGMFERISLYRPGTDDFEMLTRQRDGSIKPLSTEKLVAYKQQKAATDKIMAESFQKMMETDMTDEELGKLLEETKEKVQGVLKEKNLTRSESCMSAWSNKPDAANLAMALWLTVVDQWRQVADLERWVNTPCAINWFSNSQATRWPTTTRWLHWRTA